MDNINSKQLQLSNLLLKKSLKFFIIFNEMLGFLRESRKMFALPKKKCIILGNESCDLDSAISSICLAQYLSKNPEKIPSNECFAGVIPVLNTPRLDFPLKTEVFYVLANKHIHADSLTFKDDFENNTFENNSIILVDHHVSPYSNLVISVFDHRPFDTTSNLKNSCVKNIEEVGSCCTLIANLILNDANNYNCFKEAFKLLYGCIILDTVNFSQNAGRFKELDLSVAHRIEKLLGIENVADFRFQLFEELLSARNDVEKLNSYQLLFKDLKFLFNTSRNIKVALPGYPILVQDYLKLPNYENNVQIFAKTENCSVIVLIGMKIKDQIERDIGIINVTNQLLFEDIYHTLKSSSILDLVEYEDCRVLNGRFFKQKNITVTRKHIIPILKSVLGNYP